MKIVLSIFVILLAITGCSSFERARVSQESGFGSDKSANPTI